MNTIHILKSEGKDEDYEVWLDTGVDLCDGIRIGSSATKEAAIGAAIADLQNALNVLKLNKARGEIAEDAKIEGTFKAAANNA